MSSTPWYKQFWPWFIIALPATAVVAGLATVFIAYNNADTLVRDDYYRDGLAINRELALDDRARELGLTATVIFDAVSGEVIVQLADTGEVAKTLGLLLVHPVDASRDRTLALHGIGAGRYRADLESMPEGRFYLRLQPGEEGLWRLNGEIDFSTGPKTQLSADG